MKRACAGLFLSCFLMLVPLHSSAGHAEVVAERPVYSEGDYWVFIDAKGQRTEWRFLREENDRYVFSKEGTEVAKDFSLTETSRAGGFLGPMVKFPLKKGSWWKYEYTDTSITEGAKERIARYEAIDYEKITVAAGTFMAFRVAVTIEALFRAKKGTREIGSATYWYAPEVKQVVKWEKGDQRRELKEYKVR